MVNDSSNSVLVVAFDGLDKELIERFDLENIRQQEYGRIDNQTNVNTVGTGELFTSFITGATSNEHGITNVCTFSNRKVERFERLIEDLPYTSKFRGLRKAVYESIHSLECVWRLVNHTDYPQATFFDKVENSKSISVPGYNPSPFHSITEVFAWEMRRWDVDTEDYDREHYWRKWEYPRRKRELFSGDTQFHDLCMVHFHLPDVMQHLYPVDHPKIERTYREMDELAGRILNEYSDSFDYIIFMSDHGLPTQHEHNENAFYSCNQELFGDELPHITGFHDRVLNIVEGVEAGQPFLNPLKPRFSYAAGKKH